VQLLLRDEAKEVKDAKDVKEKKAGGNAGLFLLLELKEDSRPGD
jgi:hypothetical protein